MACGGCNSVAPVTKDQVENLIQKAIDSGKVQGGLKTCAGEKLPAESKVLMCSEVVDVVNEATKKGDIKVIKDVVYKEHKIVVTDGEGKYHEYELPYPEMAIGNKEVVFTKPDGTTVAVPKATSDAIDFDKTIVKGANEVGKLGVKVKPAGGLEATEDGVGIKAGDGLKVGEDGSLQIGEIFTKKPITGKGTKADPLSVEFSNKDFVVNPATGEISLKPAGTDQLTDLDAGKPALGYSSFFGYVDKARGVYVKGVPPDIKSEAANQSPTSSIDQLKDGEDYDFNGWQVASPVQVDQYLVGDDRAVWHRVNDGGMNQDGSLKTPTEWSDWRRETNVTVNMMELIALQKQVLDLTGRVAALENIFAGFVPLKDASGETQIGFIKP